MKKFTSLLIGLSLALAGAAIAQQPDDQPTPTGKKHAAEKTQATEAKPGANAATETAPTSGKQGGARHERAASKTQNAEATPKAAASASTETNVSGQAGTSVTPETGKGRHGKNARGANATTEASASPATATESATTGATEQTGKGKKGKNARGANATTAASATPATATSSATPAASASVSAATATSASVAPTTAASASAAPTVAASAGVQTTTGGAATVKADPQKVQQVRAQAQEIKQQHVSFRAQPRPDTVPPVTFSASYRIQGSDRWQGPQYEVYRSYHPERHDRGWYSSHYTRVELIGGGYYYWNSGYWYPAWGYDSGHEYYAYDAPIYVGHRAEPPDRVIADVQAELQQMGYYRGEVDGLLGPLTREALTAYQSDQGLVATAVIDQPTLDSLNMG